MDKSDINAVARAITALNAWKRVNGANWGIVSQMLERPLIVSGGDAVRQPVAGHILLFNGLEAYRDFRIFQGNRDISYATSPADIDHCEIVGFKDGSAQVIDFRPGFAPKPVVGDLAAALAPAVYECYGLLLRMEDEPGLTGSYAAENALFSRVEGLDGKWRDAPLKLPADGSFSWTERISYDKAKCAKASRFDLATEEVWEADFIPMPIFRTEGDNARIMYLFAAVDVRTGERRVWRKLSVDPSAARDGTLEPLKPLWESLASLLLEGILAFGKVPGAIHVNSGRMMRFLRPIGLQLPFKLVHHKMLPRLVATVNNAVVERTV